MILIYDSEHRESILQQKSDQVAPGILFFLLHFGLLHLQGHPHRLIEDFLQPLLRESTAFKRFRVQFFLNDLSSHFLPDEGLRIVVLVPQIDFIPHEQFA